MMTPTALKNRQEGLTLLEVLIALLVLAIGMAGLGALLLTALSNVHSASQFSLASAIALDFEERLWHEVALRSTDGGVTLDSQGCLTGTQLEAVINGPTGLVNRWMAQNADAGWNWTDAERVRSPGLEIVVGDPTVSSSNENSAISWQIIPLSIEWTEARFGLAGDTERYEVTVAVVCRPRFDDNGS